jgi:predicted PurR-regulated permease PerM
MKKELPNGVLPKPRRRRLLTALLMLAIFACGIIIGGGLTVKIIFSRVQDAARELSKIAERFTHRMTWYLNLTDQQSVQMEKIVNRNLARLQPLRNEIRSQLRQQMEKTRQELVKILTPAQATKLEKRFRHIRKTWLSTHSP